MFKQDNKLKEEEMIFGEKKKLEKKNKRQDKSLDKKEEITERFCQSLIFLHQMIKHHLQSCKVVMSMLLSM